MNFSPRVLHVIPSISPKRGGPSEAILPMVRALNEEGLRAEIATTDDDGPGTREVPVNALTTRAEVPVRFFHRVSPPVRAMREYAYAPGFRPWLAGHLRDYDLIHVHALFSHVSTTAMSVAGRAGAPYIVRPLGQLGLWPLRQSAWRKRLYLAMGETAHLQDAAAVHFTSHVEEREAAELGLDLRGVVIPHGMELPAPIPRAKERLRAKLGLEPRQKLVIFLGRLHRKKGLDVLLAALAGESEAMLVLAGEGEADFERELDAMIREHGLGARVIRAGFVSGEEKQLFLQGSDLFALASRHENFGVAVLESLAAGTPVLVSDQVALAGEVKKFELGRVVKLEVEAVRETLRGWLDDTADGDPERLRRFVAESYSWSANAKALSDLYRSILHGQAGGR